MSHIYLSSPTIFKYLALSKNVGHYNYHIYYILCPVYEYRILQINVLDCTKYKNCARYINIGPFLAVKMNTHFCFHAIFSDLSSL
jgi:hypothetical protein